MAVEAMHRIIKQSYFKGKVVKRLDEAIKHLLTYLEDKHHDHLIKSVKGKITRKNTNIYNNHNRASKLKDNFLVEKIEGCYLVSKGDESYKVEIKHGPCQYVSCGLNYKDCNICLHRISCICFENSIHFEMCIHCHLAIFHTLCNDSQEAESEIVQPDLAIDQNLEQIQEQHDHNVPNDNNDFDDQLPQFDAPLVQNQLDHSPTKPKTSASVAAAKERFAKRLEELVQLAEKINQSSDPVEISKGADILLRSKLQLRYHAQNRKNDQFTFGKPNPSRKRNLDHQKRQTFVSTKKKCTSRTNSLKNPTWAQRKEIISNIK